MRIREVIAGKDIQEVVTIQPDATVRQLLKVLSDFNIGAAIVSPDGAEVVGIVSERDVVRNLVHTEDLLDQPVTEIMTAVVYTATPVSTLDDVFFQMTEFRTRHLPVLDEGQLVGVVSIGDVVKNHISIVEFERDQLEGYVRRA